MASSKKEAIKRLMFDQEELRKSPVENVSAQPLDENMLEWHCNIRQDEIIYHLILFSPDNYPYKSPSAEFVPVGFNYASGATKSGKKGTQICLNIFSDFEYIHTEWKNQKGIGWSPGYTVQMVLMNVVAFLAELDNRSSSSSAYQNNLKHSKGFTCKDCGHTYNSPKPSLDFKSERLLDNKQKKKTTSKSKSKNKSEEKDDSITEIIDYISKEKFKDQKPKGVDDLFGYGLAVAGHKWRPTLASPCEFISGKSFFGMQKSVNVVHIIMKEELKLFLPLFINARHGTEIKTQFEKTLKQVAAIMPKHDPKTTPITDLVLKTIPNLMSATVVEFSKGIQHTSDNSLNGYFALHRLFLWATDTYPELQDEIERRVSEYVEDEANRMKSKVPYIAEWLMLVAASKKYRWQDVAQAYLGESFRRSPMFYVKDDVKLGDLDTPMDYRIRRTWEETEVGRKHLAFQVSFLDIAMPEGLTRGDIIKRYDDNLGFPTQDMVKELKKAFVKINTEMKDYNDWFAILKVPAPSDDELYTTFVEAVKFSIVTQGYNWTFPNGGGWPQIFAKYKEMREEAKKAKDKGNCKKEVKSKGKGNNTGGTNISGRETITNPRKKTTTSGRGKGGKTKPSHDSEREEQVEGAASLRKRGSKIEAKEAPPARGQKRKVENSKIAISAKKRK